MARQEATCLFCQASGCCIVLKVQYTLEPQLRALGLFGFLGTMQQCSMFALHALTCTPLLRAADADMCRFAFT